MTKTSVFAFLRDKLRAFGPAQGGNIALMFAGLSFPLLMVSGWAIDYSRGNSAQASMQAALDATGLALSKEAATLSREQMLDRATKYFLANFNRPDTKNIKVEPIYSDLGNGQFRLDLKVTGQVPATLTALWQESMNIGTTSEVVWGFRKLELALALDNTGSMDSKNKMTELKTAAKNLIEILRKTSKTPGDIKISIVPFNTDVNVGKANWNASWVKFDGSTDSWDANNGTCTRSRNKTKKTCEDDGESWTPANRQNTWNGCIFDRDQPRDTQNTVPDVAIADTKFPAHQTGNCPVQMMPLSSDWNALTTKINSMTPVGNTNVTIGLALALQTLSPWAPFNAVAPNKDTDKVIILLTDGDNTQNRWSSTQKTIDARTKVACQFTKDFYKNRGDTQPIKLFTIRVIDGNADLLRQCASDPTMFKDVKNAAELNQVFIDIANSLANLRLAQ